MKEMLLKLYRKRVVKAGFLVLFGILCGILFSFLGGVPSSDSSCVLQFKFIKKNLNCDLYDAKGDKLTALQNKLDILIHGYQKTGKATRVSVFVRDLITTRFAGVNETEEYYMASLLKVPLAVGAYKLAEVEPQILNQKIVYRGGPNLNQGEYVKTPQTLVAGKSYSINELITYAVQYSDNNAAQTLYDYYPNEFLDRIMQAISLDSKDKPNSLKENPTTTRSFAGVFRVLYNASYLTKEYSNELLSMLSETSYTNGATALLPKTVKVAHKFGERTITDLSGTVLRHQLHDCGVVYGRGGDEPYVFCIMTEGKNFEDLESILQEVSNETYKEMIED